MKRKIIRTSIIMLLLLVVFYCPIKPSGKHNDNSEVHIYRIGSEEIKAGRYTIQPDGDNPSYQISTDSSMSLESTVEAHMITEDLYVDLNDGEYIKTINCTILKLGE